MQTHLSKEKRETEKQRERKTERYYSANQLFISGNTTETHLPATRRLLGRRHTL